MMPIVCACFVVAWRNCTDSIDATSASTCEMNADPLSEISVVGKYVCLHIMSMMTFATVGAFAFVTGYAKRYLEKTSMAVMIC